MRCMGCNPSAAETAEATQMADPHGVGIARFFRWFCVFFLSSVSLNNIIANHDYVDVACTSHNHAHINSQRLHKKSGCQD